MVTGKKCLSIALADWVKYYISVAANKDISLTIDKGP